MTRQKWCIIQHTLASHGFVGSELAEKIHESSNKKIDVKGRYLEIDSNDLWHIRSHLTAKHKGDMPLNLTEIAWAIRNINSADVVYANVRKDGSKPIMLSLESAGGHIVLLEIDSKEMDSLRLKTAWKETPEKFAITQKSKGNNVQNQKKTDSSITSYAFASKDSISLSEEKSTLSGQNSDRNSDYIDPRELLSGALSSVAQS